MLHGNERVLQAARDPLLGIAQRAIQIEDDVLDGQIGGGFDRAVAAAAFVSRFGDHSAALTVFFHHEDTKTRSQLDSLRGFVSLW
jgi:hypothetical protein